VAEEEKEGGLAVCGGGREDGIRLVLDVIKMSGTDEEEAVGAGFEEALARLGEEETEVRAERDVRAVEEEVTRGGREGVTEVEDSLSEERSVALCNASPEMRRND